MKDNEYDIDTTNNTTTTNNNCTMNNIIGNKMEFEAEVVKNDITVIAGTPKRKLNQKNNTIVADHKKNSPSQNKQKDEKKMI